MSNAIKLLKAFTRAGHKATVIATKGGITVVDSAVHRCNSCNTVVVANHCEKPYCPACSGEMQVIAREPEFASNNEKKLYHAGICGSCGSSLSINKPLLKAIASTGVTHLNCIMCSDEVDVDSVSEEDIISFDPEDEGEEGNPEFDEENNTLDLGDDESEGGDPDFLNVDDLPTYEDDSDDSGSFGNEDEYDDSFEQEDVTETEMDTGDDLDEEMSDVLARLAKVYPGMITTKGGKTSLDFDVINARKGKVPAIAISAKLLTSTETASFIGMCLTKGVFTIKAESEGVDETETDETAPEENTEGETEENKDGSGVNTIDINPTELPPIEPTGEVDDSGVPAPATDETVTENVQTIEMTPAADSAPEGNDAGAEEVIDLMDETETELNKDDQSIDEAVPEEETDGTEESGVPTFSIVKASASHNSDYIFFVNKRPVATASIANVTAKNVVSIFGKPEAFKGAVSLSFKRDGRKVLASYGFRPITIKLGRASLLAKNIAKAKEQATVAYTGRINDVSAQFEQATSVVCAGMAKGIYPSSFKKTLVAALENGGFSDADSFVTSILESSFKTLFTEVVSKTRELSEMSESELNAVANLISNKEAHATKVTDSLGTALKNSAVTAKVETASTKKPSISVKDYFNWIGHKR